ncbi:nucleotidyltransferase family protein [Paenibacillus tarimensis]
MNYENEYENRLREWMYTNEAIVADLQLVRSLNLPDGYIAAGYVRNYIWDRLHGYDQRTGLNDIDLVYFDDRNTAEAADRGIEARLQQLTGDARWSVKNQARMHLRNKTEPYRSVSDALSRWPETATAVGIRLTEDDRVDICCPHGLKDLFELNIKRSPFFYDESFFRQRVEIKRWLVTWPLLRVIE